MRSRPPAHPDNQSSLPRASRKGTPLRPRLKRNLSLGETPFDDLDRETLIRLLCAHQAALQGTQSALRMARDNQERTAGLGPFWVGPMGYARRAMARAEYLLTLVSGRKGEHAQEQLDAYARHIEELAFPPDEGDHAPHPTMTCSRCGVWCRRSGMDPRPFQGNLRLCGPGSCDCPPHAPLTWDLLRAGEVAPAE